MSFKSGYQGGAFYEVLSTQGKDSAVNWKFTSSSIKKVYEKDAKGYVFNLEGAPATTKLQSPKDSKQSLTLIQRYLVIQIYIAKGADFSVELGVSDLSNNKRRIMLSTSLRETQVTPLHAKVPLTVVRRAVWLNLVLDMVSLVGDTWTSHTFRAVDHISVSANCKLRRVFTMKSQPLDTTDDDELYGCSSTNSGEIDSIPRQCQMASDVNQCTQVLTLNKVKCAERLKSTKAPGIGDQCRSGSTLDLDLNSSSRKVNSSDGKIGFGAKAPRLPPETGRKTSRQGSLTNRSTKSSTSRLDSNSNNNRIGSTDSLTSREPAIDHMDFVKPRPPASAGSITSLSSHNGNSAMYNRQQSEPVTQEDYGFIGINGLKDNQLVAPHPPREPSNDRVRRRPRIKSLGQNGVINRGDPSKASPPTSALRGAASAHSIQASSTASSLQKPEEVRVSVGQRSMKDSGVGPDVPEIQSPRKGDVHSPSESSHLMRESVSDVISLLKNELPRFDIQQDSQHRENKRREDIWEVKENNRREIWGMEEENEEEEYSNASSSASDGSNPGEYEESEEESSETGKLHLFFSPPKSAPRRNISPSAEAEDIQPKKNFSKALRTNVKRSSDKNLQRGARLEDDFISRSSSDEEILGLRGADFISFPHSSLSRRPGQRHPPQIIPQSSGHNSSSGYSSNNYASSSTSTTKGHNGRSKPPAPMASMLPQMSTSPDQKPIYNSRLYSDSQVKSRDSLRNSVSRMSRSSLREINNPLLDLESKPYNVGKYQFDELSESFEAQMLASMERQVKASLEDLSPPPGSSAPPHNGQGHPTLLLYSESPATTSDDDTSFSTWKAPAQNLAPHNYQDEMKSRRSNDTLTSSNPRDWSTLLSPPVGPVAGGQDLQGTLDGIPDELSDDASGRQESQRNGLKSDGEEEKLDLVFDSKLNCYYDPSTQKWYELVS